MFVTFGRRTVLHALKGRSWVQPTSVCVRRATCHTPFGMQQQQVQGGKKNKVGFVSGLSVHIATFLLLFKKIGSIIDDFQQQQRTKNRNTNDPNAS
jgi:hypothetical protein